MNVSLLNFERCPHSMYIQVSLKLGSEDVTLLKGSSHFRGFAEDVPLLERCSHFRLCNVQTSTELGLEEYPF